MSGRKRRGRGPARTRLPRPRTEHGLHNEEEAATSPGPAPHTAAPGSRAAREGPVVHACGPRRLPASSEGPPELPEHPGWTWAGRGCGWAGP